MRKMKYLVILVMLLNLIGCQSSKINEQIIPANDSRIKQVEALKNFSEQFVVRPGQVTLLRFPYLGPFEDESLACNGRSVPFFVDENLGQAMAYLAPSYFDEGKDFICQFHFGANEKNLAPTKARVGKIVVEKFEYPKEELNVDRKKIVLSTEDQERVAKEKNLLEKIYQASAKRPLFNEPFSVPLNSFITSYFGTKRIFNNEVSTQHLGTDFRAAIGTTIKPANRGRVVFVGELFFDGNMVLVDHGAGVFTNYSHLSKILVQVGQMVTKDTPIGLSGMTGRVNGPHLHWGVKVQGESASGHSLVDASVNNFPARGVVVSKD